MNGWHGEVIEYDASQSHPYKVRFDDPKHQLAMKDWWFGESELKPHVLGTGTVNVPPGVSASAGVASLSSDLEKMWQELHTRWGTDNTSKTCTCGADKVYGDNVTAFHHAPYCDKFKHKDNT